MHELSVTRGYAGVSARVCVHIYLVADVFTEPLFFFFHVVEPGPEEPLIMKADVEH